MSAAGRNKPGNNIASMYGYVKKSLPIMRSVIILLDTQSIASAVFHYIEELS
jgi:hypothetical protein